MALSACGDGAAKHPVLRAPPTPEPTPQVLTLAATTDWTAIADVAIVQDLAWGPGGVTAAPPPAVAEYESSRDKFGDVAVGFHRRSAKIPNTVQRAAFALITGPSPKEITIQITQHDDTGAHSLQNVRWPANADKWVFWEVMLLPSKGDRTLELSTYDGGISTGAWLAVSGPFVPANQALP